MQSAAERTHPPRILVAEDDFLVALDVEALLLAEGWVVDGPFPSVVAALDHLARAPTPHLALLDVNLSGERATPIAAALIAGGIPFVLISGYSRSQLPEAEFAAAPIVPKPFTGPRLIRAIRALLH